MVENSPHALYGLRWALTQRLGLREVGFDVGEQSADMRRAVSQ